MNYIYYLSIRSSPGDKRHEQNSFAESLRFAAWQNLESCLASTRELLKYISMVSFSLVDNSKAKEKKALLRKGYAVSYQSDYLQTALFRTLLSIRLLCSRRSINTKHFRPFRFNLIGARFSCIFCIDDFRL